MSTGRCCLSCALERKDVPATVVVDGDPLCGACVRTWGVEAAVAEPEPEPTIPALPPMGPKLCSRLCGKPTHRGLCKRTYPRQSGPGAAGSEEAAATVANVEVAVAVEADADGSDEAAAKVDAAASVGAALLKVAVDAALVEAAIAEASDSGVPAKRRGAQLGKKVVMDSLVCKEVRLDQVPRATGRRLMGRSGELWARLLWLTDGVALEVTCRDAGHVGQTVQGVLRKARQAKVAIEYRRAGGTLYVWRARVEEGA